MNRYLLDTNHLSAYLDRRVPGIAGHPFAATNSETPDDEPATVP